MAPRVTCECGECRKCKHRVYMRTWYAKNAASHRQTAKASRQRRIEKVRAYDRERGFRVYDVNKVQARKIANIAVNNGTLTKSPCEVCGAPSEAHHDDYNKPLVVRWLCRPHHAELHRRF